MNIQHIFQLNCKFPWRIECGLNGLQILVLLSVLSLMVVIPVFANALEDAEKVVFEWSGESPVGGRSEFLSDVTSLLKMKQEFSGSIEAVNLQQDKLQYFQERLRDGELDQVELWSFAESLTKARRKLITDRQTFEMALESTARKWGGDHWWLLMDLLAEYVSASRPLPD